MINWIYRSCFRRSFACLLALLHRQVSSRGPWKRLPDSRLHRSVTWPKLKASRFYIWPVGARGSTVGECGRRVAWNKAAFVVP